MQFEFRSGCIIKKRLILSLPDLQTTFRPHVCRRICRKMGLLHGKFIMHTLCIVCLMAYMLCLRFNSVVKLCMGWVHQSLARGVPQSNPGHKTAVSQRLSFSNGSPSLMALLSQQGIIQNFSMPDPILEAYNRFLPVVGPNNRITYRDTDQEATSFFLPIAAQAMLCHVSLPTQVHRPWCDIDELVPEVAFDSSSSLSPKSNSWLSPTSTSYSSPAQETLTHPRCPPLLQQCGSSISHSWDHPVMGFSG